MIAYRLLGLRPLSHVSAQTAGCQCGPGVSPGARLHRGCGRNQQAVLAVGEAPVRRGGPRGPDDAGDQASYGVPSSLSQSSSPPAVLNRISRADLNFPSLDLQALVLHGDPGAEVDGETLV